MLTEITKAIRASRSRRLRHCASDTVLEKGLGEQSPRSRHSLLSSVSKMRHFVVFVASFLLIGKTAGDETTSQEVPPEDICNEFGNAFCKGAATCNASKDVKETFTCKCEKDNMYFDAAKELCQYKKSCATMECSVGHCKEAGANQANCVCENSYRLTLFCKVKDFFTEECKKKGGTAVMATYSSGGARCDCGQWAAMNSANTQCVPTTCLYPSLSCRDLCENNLLDKDQRCCEGWDQKNCSKAPQDDTYCSPGTTRKDGNCESVCKTGEAKLLCKNGCKRSQVPGRAYECLCNSGYVVAEDGIQCKVNYKRPVCNTEEERNCLPGQRCIVKNNTTECECPHNQHLQDGKCTGDCSQNKCHEDFADCGVYFGKQRCFCPWTSRKNPRSPQTKHCTLNEYYYTVSFKPNISLDAHNCDAYKTRVLEAMRTTIGPEVYMVEILSCTDDIKARLITGKQLSPYLLKKLQICEYPEGDACIVYPKLPIQKGSATEIEEENICDSLLKAQADATNATNECVRDGNYFWFKCKRGFREVDVKTRGRLRRSVCEPGVSCDENDEQKCHRTGHVCIPEGLQVVCKCPRGKVEDQGNCKATCTQEKKEECEKKDEECVVDNDEAVCRIKGDSTATTEVPPGTGSRTVPVSAVFLLAILIPAVYT